MVYRVEDKIVLAMNKTSLILNTVLISVVAPSGIFHWPRTSDLGLPGLISIYLRMDISTRNSTDSVTFFQCRVLSLSSTHSYMYIWVHCLPCVYSVGLIVRAYYVRQVE